MGLLKTRDRRGRGFRRLASGRAAAPRARHTAPARPNPVGFRGRIAVAFGSANRFEWEAAVACAATAGSEHVDKHGHVLGMFGTAGSPRAEERHPRIAGACELAG